MMDNCSPLVHVMGHGSAANPAQTLCHSQEPSPHGGCGQERSWGSSW